MRNLAQVEHWDGVHRIDSRWHVNSLQRTFVYSLTCGRWSLFRVSRSRIDRVARWRSHPQTANEICWGAWNRNENNKLFCADRFIRLNDDTDWTKWHTNWRFKEINKSEIKISYFWKGSCQFPSRFKWYIKSKIIVKGLNLRTQYPFLRSKLVL